MAFSCSVAGPLVKLVSPMTSAPRVVSTTTKLSDEIERRLNASAGYDSLVHCQSDPVWCTRPFSDSTQNFLDVVTAVLLRRGKRQLECRAFDVIDEDVQVVRIDERMLW